MKCFIINILTSRKTVFKFTVCGLLTFFISSCNVSNSDKKQQEETLLLKASLLHSKYDSLLFRHRNDTVYLSNQLKKAIKEKNIHLQIVGNSYLGNFYYNNFSYDDALLYHHKSLDLAESTHNPLFKSCAYNSIGRDLWMIGVLSKSAENYFHSYFILKSLPEFSNPEVLNQLQSTYNGLGDVFLSLEDPNEALIYYNKAFTISKSLHQSENIAENQARIGRAYKQKQRYDSAMIFYNESLKNYILLESEQGIANCYLRLGNLYRVQRENDSVLTYLTKAYEMLTQETTDKINFIDVCYSLGEFRINTSDYDTALELIQKGILTSENIRSNVNLKRGHDLLAQLFKKQEMNSLAFNELAYRDQYDAKIRNQQRLGRIVDIKSQYENEKNKQFIVQLESKQEIINKKHHIATILILVIGGLLFTSVIVFFYHLQLRKKKNEAVIKLEKLKTDFYKNITNDFKTPVNIILGLVEGLKHTIKTGNTKRNLHNLDIISRQSENLLHLINEIISISNIKINKNETEYQNGNIIVYLRYLFTCFQNIAEEKGIRYIFDSTSDELVMDFSSQDMNLIINNLLSNSFKNCKKDDKILFLVRHSADYCVIEISDSGKGISKDDLPYLFDLYYQGKNDYIKNSDTGISLNFTKQLVEKLDGKIHVKSEPFVKTAFTIELPITNRILTGSIENPAISKSEISANIPNLHEDEIDKSPKIDIKLPLILIAEDNKDLTYYVTSILKDNYIVISATNGTEAFELAQKHLPDLIISDFIMPEKNGCQLCELIKQSELTSHIPFIMLTAKTDLQDRVNSFKVGVDAYITKPFHEEELLAIVSQLLKNRKIIKEKFKDIIFKDTHTFEEKTDKDFEFLQKVSTIVLREIKNTEFFPQGLASELAISTSQLNRKLNSISGLSCMNFVNQIRLNKAKKLLLSSMKPIGDIAMECGFSDFAYFSRSFKKEFGITPSQYQRISQLKKII